MAINHDALIEDIARQLSLFRPTELPWPGIPEARKDMRRNEARALLTDGKLAELLGQPVDTVAFLQGRRREALRALRACPDANADYWRWQGHAELSRQLLERLGAEVPQ